MAVSVQSGLDHCALLPLLADGQVRSGAWLARNLGVSSAAISAGIQRLRARGVPISATARRGFQLPMPVELLDARTIRAALGDTQGLKLRNLEVLFEVDSTNSRLLARVPPPEGLADVCISELQHSGRGRRGRHWVAPFGDCLAMSVAWCFRDAMQATPSLSLAVGVAIFRALQRAGAQGIRLKWPNDVCLKDRKLGGVLVELKTDVGGTAHVVIGVGLNVSLSTAAQSEIEQTGVRVAAVADACAAAPSRNHVAGVLLDELLSMLGRFEQESFAPFRDAWLELDALCGRPVRIIVGEGAICGTARGVDEDGALLLESAGCVQRFVSGEVSVRLSEDDGRC